MVYEMTPRCEWHDEGERCIFPVDHMGDCSFNLEQLPCGAMDDHDLCMEFEGHCGRCDALVKPRPPSGA